MTVATQSLRFSDAEAFQRREMPRRPAQLNVHTANELQALWQRVQSKFRTTGTTSAVRIACASRSLTRERFHDNHNVQHCESTGQQRDSQAKLGEVAQSIPVCSTTEQRCQLRFCLASTSLGPLPGPGRSRARASKLHLNHFFLSEQALPDLKVEFGNIDSSVDTCDVDSRSHQQSA